MKTLRTLVYLLLVSTCMDLSSEAAQPPTPESVIAQEVLRRTRAVVRSNLVAAAQVCEMVKVTNSFHGLSDFANSCKRDPSFLTNEFLLMSLVEGIRLRTAAPVTDSDQLVVPSRVKSGKMRPSEDARTVRQDVLLQGGRAAWFIEQLLGSELPEVSEQSTQEDIEDVVFDAYYNVREALLPPDALRSIDGLSLDQKQHLASSEGSNEVIISKLSKDPAPSVRKRVASSKNAPIPVLARLARDRDSEVKRLALKNLELARSLSE